MQDDATRTYNTGELLDLVEQAYGSWVTVKSVRSDGVGPRHLRKSSLGWFWQVGPDLDSTMVLRSEFLALHANGLWVVICIGIFAHDYDDAGNWAIPDSANPVGRGRRTGWKRDYGTNRPPVEIAAVAATGTNAPATTNMDVGPDSSQLESIIVIEQPNDSGQSTDTPQPSTDSAPTGNPNDPLTRLMNARANEEHQLGSQRQ